MRNEKVQKKVLLVALSVVLLCAMIAPAAAGPTDVGVKVGDWFKIRARVAQWVSSDPFLPDGYIGPLSLADNQTNSIVYTVTAITPVGSAKNVTFSVTYNWKNGSVTTSSFDETVSTANTNIFLIGSNMTTGQMVSDSFDFLGMGFFTYPQRFIGRTFNLVTPNGTRATNECNYTVEIFGANYEYHMWWDQITGIRIYYWNHGVVPAMFTADYTYTVVYELIDSSINGVLVPDLAGPLMLVILMTITTVPILLYKRKRLLI